MNEKDLIPQWNTFGKKSGGKVTKESKSFDTGATLIAEIGDATFKINVDTERVSKDTEREIDVDDWDYTYAIRGTVEKNRREVERNFFGIVDTNTKREIDEEFEFFIDYFEDVL
jgi:hypothetical protein